MSTTNCCHVKATKASASSTSVVMWAHQQVRVVDIQGLLNFKVLPALLWRLRRPLHHCLNVVLHKAKLAFVG